MQNEYKTLNKYYSLFPGKEKGCQDVCQTSLFVSNKIYRDFLLTLEPKHHVLIETFLFEVTRGHVKSNDVNWFNRFKKLAGQEQTVIKQPIKKQVTDKFTKGDKEPLLKKKAAKPVVDPDEDVDDKIEEKVGSDSDDKVDSGSDVVDEAVDEASEEMVL